jgi:hypothetical protein
LEREQERLDARAIQEDATPVEPVPADRASVLAELRRVGATITTADGRTGGPVIKVALTNSPEANNKTMAYVAVLLDLEELSATWSG